MNQSIYKSTKRECEKPTSPDTNNSVQCDDKVTIVIAVEGLNLPARCNSRGRRALTSCDTRFLACSSERDGESLHGH